MIIVYVVAFLCLIGALTLSLTAPQFLPFVLGLMLGAILTSVEDQVVTDIADKNAKDKN